MRRADRYIKQVGLCPAAFAFSCVVSMKNLDSAESMKGRLLRSLEGQYKEARLKGDTGESIRRVILLEVARLQNELCGLQEELAQAGIDRTYEVCVRIDKWGIHTELSVN